MTFNCNTPSQYEAAAPASKVGFRPGATLATSQSPHPVSPELREDSSLDCFLQQKLYFRVSSQQKENMSSSQGRRKQRQRCKLLSHFFALKIQSKQLTYLDTKLYRKETLNSLPKKRNETKAQRRKYAKTVTRVPAGGEALGTPTCTPLFLLHSSLPAF